MSAPESSTAVDGRRLRSERSRQAIIDASIALVEEGNLVPTAQQVSERAGVGIRSFFRHFADMETLCSAMDEQLRDTLKSKFVGGDREGTLQQRIRHAVERHAHAYESIGALIKSTLAQRWRYQILQENYARYQRGLRRDLDDWLPELAALPPHRREAVDALASFEFWDRLRDQQQQGLENSIEIVAELLTDLVPDTHLPTSDHALKH